MCPDSTDIGPELADSRPASAEFVRNRPGLGPSLAVSGPNLAKVGPHSVESAQNRSMPSQTGPISVELIQIRPCRAKPSPNLAEPSPTRVHPPWIAASPNLVDHNPFIVEPGPNSAGAAVHRVSLGKQIKRTVTETRRKWWSRGESQEAGWPLLQPFSSTPSLAHVSDPQRGSACLGTPMARRS